MNPCGSMDRPRFSVRSSPLRIALLSEELQPHVMKAMSHVNFSQVSFLTLRRLVVFSYPKFFF